MVMILICYVNILICYVVCTCLLCLLCATGMWQRDPSYMLCKTTNFISTEAFPLSTLTKQSQWIYLHILSIIFICVHLYIIYIIFIHFEHTTVVADLIQTLFIDTSLWTILDSYLLFWTFSVSDSFVFIDMSIYIYIHIFVLFRLDFSNQVILAVFL